MPTDPVRRVENWDSKYNVEQIAATLTVKRPKMLQHATEAFVSLAAMESQVKQMCDAAGASVIELPFYLCFGREMWHLTQREISGDAAAKETAVLIAKWVWSDRVCFIS